MSAWNTRSQFISTYLFIYLHCAWGCRLGLQTRRLTPPLSGKRVPCTAVDVTFFIKYAQNELNEHIVRPQRTPTAKLTAYAVRLHGFLAIPVSHRAQNGSFFCYFHRKCRRWRYRTGSGTRQHNLNSRFFTLFCSFRSYQHSRRRSIKARFFLRCKSFICFCCAAASRWRNVRIASVQR